MTTDIVVRKGLNLKLKGEAVLETVNPKIHQTIQFIHLIFMEFTPNWLSKKMPK